ncbi:Transcriptional regulator of acetoin/glycerol metabolism [Rhizobiales bacterium GAS191]|nr:Transcriptional regulator of acetoin/glycerol metabolism [Rhizobiales bacterium GAS191]
MDERSVRAAWEEFVESGHVHEGVRGSIAESWQRSKTHRVAIGRAEAPLASEAELHRRRHENSALVCAARPALKASAAFLSDASSMMILTDISGMIIETEGDQRIVQSGRANHLEIGGYWNEANIGTNAIGTALSMRKPVQVHAAEHFCTEIQKWTCAAAPICDPVDHDVLGIVDISGPAKLFNPQSLALAVSIRLQIEALLTQSARAEHAALVCHYFAKRSRWATDEIIAIDRRGMVVRATSRALDEANFSSPVSDTAKAFTALKGVPLSDWPEKLEKIIRHASAHVVLHEGEEVGAIIISKSRRHGPARSALAAERDLPAELRDALADLLADDRSAGARNSPRDVPDASVAATGTQHSRQAARRPTPQRDPPVAAFVAEDPAVARIVRQVETAAARHLPILIRGETGTGKEQLARHAHATSGRGGAFVPINCAALPESLIEAELFGYADGAFTGARKGGAIGLVREADGGTLFLDEIGDMPVALQAVLLRLLDDWTVRPVGGARHKVDVLLVSATNAKLDRAIAEGRFRSDLLYRLNVLEVVLPSLADRSDFEPILRHLLKEIDADREISQAAIVSLADKPWPGNIRELRNTLARLTLSGNDRIIDDKVIEMMAVHSPSSGSLRDTQRARVLAAHTEAAGNISETARRLGVSRNTVYRALDPHGRS